MAGKLRAIAWFTAVETLGHPAMLLLTLASVAGTLTLPFFQFQRFSEDGRLARDCGLSTALLFGALIAIGGAARLRRALTDGTAAIALSKPLPRGLWLCGNALGTGAALAVYLLTQGAAVLLAEAYSPRYHAGGAYADVPGLLTALGAAAAALALAAAANRFRDARFALSATAFLPAALWALVPFAPNPHWGTLSALPAVAMLLAQVVALAAALAVRCAAGPTAGLSAAALAACLVFFGGVAYLPLGPLAGGGAVPWGTLAWLMPQTLCATSLFLWCGASLLNARATL